MDDEDGAIRPIAVADTQDLPSGSAQALVAATFTLMTAYALGTSDGERAATAAQVDESLALLEDMTDLDAEFRRLCGRLRALWARQAA